MSTSSLQPTWHRPRNSTLDCALACLIDPPTLIALGLLLLNDHLLKATVPSWWTGKLSDLAGLYFFPLLVLAFLSPIEMLASRIHRSPKHTHGWMASALLFSGLWFVALKATPASNARAVALLEALTGRTHVVVADPTDLLALVVLPLAWVRWRALLRNQDSTGTASSTGAAGPAQGLLAERPSLELGAGRARRRRCFSLVVLVVASLATVATTPAREAYSFGAVFDVAADPAQGDLLYAGLATQRVLKCKEGTLLPQWGPDCVPEEVAYSVETYRSQDGGRTWSLYTEVGGYLWADPHTPGRLYVLSEEGLHRVEEGRAHALQVPFKETRIRFFPDEPTDAYVPTNVHPLAFDPTTRDVLYLADGQHILASTDGGETWERRSSAPLWDMAGLVALSLAPSAPQTLYAAGGNTVLRSDDGGRHWIRNARLGDGVGLGALAVHPATPEIVYAAGTGIWLSADGGDTWQKVYAGEVLDALALHPSDPDRIYAVGHHIRMAKEPSFTGAVYSDDGGQAWHPLGDLPGWDIAISQAAPHRAIVALGEQGIAVHDAPRHDPQQGWKQFSEGLPVFSREH
jgi:photosystem II stability/assembly factor-like uncharacterized protein